MKWPKLWKLLFLFPALVAWQSTSKDRRDKVKKEVNEVFTLFGDKWEKIWEKPKPEPKPEPLIDFDDFDVILVDEKGRSSGRTNSSVFQVGNHGKVEPGVYKAIRIESPSMDALKYVSINKYVGLVKKVSIPINTAKTLRLNDTLDMSMAIKVGDDGVELGRIHFRWDCVG